MAVKIRLKRMGAKKKPFYRVVVADSRSPRDGKFIEEIGWVDPLKDPAEIQIDVAAARKWLGNGAQPTDTARAILKKAGAYDEPAEDEEAPEAIADAPVVAEENASEKAEDLATEDAATETEAEQQEEESTETVSEEAENTDTSDHVDNE